MNATRSTSGFTLIEMLVALFIFGMLASASVLLLRQSVDAQAASGERLDEMGELRRFDALATQDLGSAIARPTRGESGELRPAFVARGTPAALFAFVRHVPLIEDQGIASSVQRVVYGFDGAAITRSVAPMASGMVAGEPVPILRGIERVEVRLRDPDGIWLTDWQPQRVDTMPVAIEMSIYRAGYGPEPLVLKFLVGNGQ